MTLVRNLQSAKNIYKELAAIKWTFLIVFLFVFFLSFSFLSSLDFVPDVNGENEEASVADVVLETEDEEEEEGLAAMVYPEHITIPSIGVDSDIETPESRDIAVLDDSLTRGVVHYPGSGILEEDANMFLFGHSSSLPVVRNPAYQAFNNLGTLSLGDEIKIQGGGKEYVYHVTSLQLAKAEEALVEFETGKRQITLSTCNSFGAKDDRFVVEADFVESYPITN